MITLPFQGIVGCCKDQLTKVSRELTEEDIEYYERVGWRYFSEEDLDTYLLPSLGEPIGFNVQPVIEIKGKKYQVVIQDDGREPWDEEGKTLLLIPTTAPLTKGDPGNRRSFYNFFGQPTWRQNTYYPTHKGKPCYHLVTVEDGWGDNGNRNILLGFDENDMPEAAYFEASCC